ncbi:hypothetical protein Lal_00023237 [Lupinus albus]|nr:hypothetical protein Lal_00023237 [Lupinus albus]
MKENEGFRVMKYTCETLSSFSKIQLANKASKFIPWELSSLWINHIKKGKDYLSCFHKRKSDSRSTMTPMHKTTKNLMTHEAHMPYHMGTRTNKPIDNLFSHTTAHRANHEYFITSMLSYDSTKSTNTSIPTDECHTAATHT